MSPKMISLALLIFVVAAAHSQDILKKVKANKTLSADNLLNKPAGNNTANNSNDDKKPSWCDAPLPNANPVYTLAYSSPSNFSIMYDESRLGVNGNKNNFRLILKQQVGNKPQFVIVDNGKVTATVASLSKDDILGGIHQPLDGLNNAVSEPDNTKYLVAETNTINTSAQAARTVTTAQTLNANQISKAYEMMKNTDEYKKKSPEEKQKMEEAMKQMPQMANAYNNSGVNGKTFSTPEVKAGTYTTPSGYYNIVVKGKSYGKFLGVPQLKVSDDEANVYIVGQDDKGNSDFIANGKKIPLDAKAANYMPHTGYLVISADGKKAAFAEIKQLSEKEQEDMLKAAQTGAVIKQNFIITKSDGSSYTLARTDGGDNFRLMNSGTLVYINTNTGEVMADGKTIGKFTMNGGEQLNSGALLFGSDASKICYYSENGSLNYMDGSKIEMEILFPQVITENGKNYITWFRKCKNAIYIGKFEF